MWMKQETWEEEQVFRGGNHSFKDVKFENLMRQWAFRKWCTKHAAVVTLAIYTT